MNDRVVCVMSVGAGKYRKQYELVRDNLMAYEKKCHADFRFIDTILIRIRSGIFIPRSS